MDYTMNQRHQMVSLADQVFEALETDILSGVYDKEEILSETKLSEKMQVSRTPIREALKRLSMEHIIEMTSKGAKVIGITQEDISDIYEIRLRIEGIVAARAAAAMTDEDIQLLKETLELQEFYTQKAATDSIKNMDSRFHQIIYEHCGSNTYRDTLEPLHRKIMKYRRVSVSVPSRATQSLAEHRGIYEAIAARDVEKAQALMLEHIAHARDSILSRT